MGEINRPCEISPELVALLPNGLPRVSIYNEFLRITDRADTDTNFIAWSQIAMLVMGQMDGHA